MDGGMEKVVNSWLIDPAWQKVFKHTLDVITDYVSYVLVSVGAVALSVRLLTTVGTGDLVCLIVGVKDAEMGSLGAYPGGGTLGLISYAQTEQKCINSVFSPFKEYLPFIMLLQTLILVIVEKFTFKIPRIAQKVERFYKNIVEESLFGKDPDVTEDMTDTKTSTEAISRRRQRNEICVSLKRSSIIHRVYIGKNFVEIILGIIFFLVNLKHALLPMDPNTRCEVEIQSFPGIVDEEGTVLFQCRGKKMGFFNLALWAQIILIGIHVVLSFGSLIWCWRFRSVTRLLKTIEAMQKDWEPDIVNGVEGADFLFLFDLLSHSCGIESTLRVLTHSDDTFYNICRPKINVKDFLHLEEDRLKVTWRPADIEKWLHNGKRKSNAEKIITVDCYEITIFPAESVKNSQSVVPKELGLEGAEYSAWFYDLQGGRTEYVLTVATMIGKSRMKGTKIVTTLMPYGPERPRTGMLKSAGTHQADIFWDPPKGEFTKYTLSVEQLRDMFSPIGSEFGSVISTSSLNSTGEMVRNLQNLSYKLTNYTILGLKPGEMYKVELGTKTANVASRQPIMENVLTKPLPLSGLTASDIHPNSCVIQWLKLHGHACLKGFHIILTTNDGKTFKNITIPKMVKSFRFTDLSPGSDYDFHVTTLCVSGERRTESEPAVLAFSTPPEPVNNLRLEAASSNTLHVKWDPVTTLTTTCVYNLSIECKEIEYSFSLDITGDKSQYMFSKLPDPDGSGKKYTVSIRVSLLTLKENEIKSETSKDFFYTLPIKPSNLRVGSEPNQIEWTKSPTSTVESYKIRWKTEEEPPIKLEATVDDCSYTFEDLRPGTIYRVNVYAMVRALTGFIESKELHEKLVVDDGGQLFLYEDEEVKN
ncbi:uncharacterized protein LOC131877137 [Tigriopus californicus]|uniref:uncharacterized protein LOC131877137 n=1 Tax=Tigriopus californicus TaxID=6832 RepID=UPI0027DA7824|nr:uncharacterized protein LOC131877137 [Tigriopus californicus]|eukprot:TCALIF_06385-PA protein Name:"Similar to Tnn Tenascin-N (Mus musculus)" AED:0.39 eAED:0.70 QI:0/-1/0/1/-1/1/1/0/869